MSGATQETFCLERHCRRPGWRQGRPVRLADGSSWEIPPIDAGLLADDPALADDLRAVQALARGPRPGAEDPGSDLDALRELHGRLAVVAIRALRTNYALPDCAWGALLVGNTLIETLQLTAALAFALDEAGRDPVRPGPAPDQSRPPVAPSANVPGIEASAPPSPGFDCSKRCQPPHSGQVPSSRPGRSVSG